MTWERAAPWRAAPSRLILNSSSEMLSGASALGWCGLHVVSGEVQTLKTLRRQLSALVPLEFDP